MQHSASGARMAQLGLRVRVRRDSDRDNGANPQARTAVTGQCCGRCPDVASILVASDAIMMRQKERKSAATREDVTTGRSSG